MLFSVPIHNSNPIPIPACQKCDGRDIWQTGLLKDDRTTERLDKRQDNVETGRRPTQFSDCCKWKLTRSILGVYFKSTTLYKITTKCNCTTLHTWLAISFCWNAGYPSVWGPLFCTRKIGNVIHLNTAHTEVLTHAHLFTCKNCPDNNSIILFFTRNVAISSYFRNNALVCHAHIE